MKQQFLRDKTDTIRLTVYQDNRAVVPTSATIELQTPNGSELQASVGVTAINSTTGEMTFDLTATHTDDKDLDYIAIWSYVVSSTTHTERQLWDVVISRLSIPITDNDLFSELDSLRRTNAQEVNTATSGAAGSITDTSRKEADDFWTGGIVQILEGTGQGQKRSVSDFVQSTGVISVSPDWTTNPDSTSVYRVVKSYTNKIITSFEKLEQMFYDAGRRHELIMESSQIRIPLIYLTVHFITLDLRQDIDDKWDMLVKDYWAKFQDSWSKLNLSYDTDESGTIDDEESQFKVNRVRIYRT